MLGVTDFHCGGGLTTKKISGLTAEELQALKFMRNSEATDRLMELLDKRNDNLGTRWQCGYGVYAVWFDNEFAYVNIGNSSD